MDANEESILAYVAWESGEAYTEFGPCLCGGSQENPCLSCQKANEIEAAGLDWETEYQKWNKARSNRKHDPFF